MLRNRLLASAAAATILLTLGVTTAFAASTVVECGQLSGYTAPDPLGPTDGSLQIGTLAPWDVLATATVSANAEATLPSIVNSGPTCLALDLDDDGDITAIDFAATGTITGTVTLDSGYYLFDERLIIPTVITDAEPGLGALFATSHSAGTSLSVTFTVDTTTGQFLGFDGEAEFCGPGSLSQDGDGQVGDATIPGEVLDDDDREALEDADGAETCASVHSVGTIDPQSGDISIDTDVVIDVATPDDTPRPAPTAPPTSVAGASHDSSGPGSVVLLVLISAATALAFVTRRLSPR